MWKSWEESLEPCKKVVDLLLRLLSLADIQVMRVLWSDKWLRKAKPEPFSENKLLNKGQYARSQKTFVDQLYITARVLVDKDKLLWPTRVYWYQTTKSSSAVDSS